MIAHSHIQIDTIVLKAITTEITYFTTTQLPQTNKQTNTTLITPTTPDTKPH